MSQTWDLETPMVSSNDVKLARVVHNIFGDKFPHINENVTKAMSLYTYLAKRMGEPVAKLAAEIRDEGKPLFTEKDIREIQAILKKHKDNYASFFQRVVREQKGGAPPLSKLAGKPMAGAPPTNPLDADPSRSKFFDKMIRKIMYPITSRIPPAWDGVLWYTFIIYNLEQIEFIGPFISTALDTVTLSLPVIAELASTGFENLIMLAPVPYAGVVGGIAGHIISLIFILFAVFLNMARKHFGSAFKVSLEAIPMFGDMLMDAAQSVETGVERYIRNRDKMLTPIGKISPALYDNLDYYVPDTDIHLTTPPPLTYDILKADVAGYVLKETGIADTIAGATAKIPTVSNIVPGASKNDASKNEADKNDIRKNEAGKNEAGKNDAAKNIAVQSAANKNKAEKSAKKKGGSRTNSVQRTSKRRIKGTRHRYTRRR